MKYQGWNGMWKVAITDQIATTCLIGLDLSEHVKSVFITTHSQLEEIETLEEKCKISDEEIGENEANELAEVVKIRNPHENSFKKEQRQDSTLQQCFKLAREGPITPEYLDRVFVDGDLLYREVLLNPKRGGEASTDNWSPLFNTGKR